MTKELDLTPTAKKVVKEAEELAKGKDKAYQILYLFSSCVKNLSDKSLSFIEGKGIRLDVESFDIFIENEFRELAFENLPINFSILEIIQESEYFAKDSGDYFVGVEHIIFSSLLDPNLCECLGRFEIDHQELEGVISMMVADSNSLHSRQQSAEFDFSTNIEDYIYKSIPEIFSKYCKLMNYDTVLNNSHPVIGREKEINQLEEILSKKIKSNAIFVGESGVGKTAIVEGFVQKIINNKVPNHIAGLNIFSVDINAMVSGAYYRGQFEERFKELVAEAEKNPNIVLFFDEIHNVIGAGNNGDGGMDASNILKPALARGSIKCIGATTEKEYKKYFEKDSAFKRRFDKIDVLEPTKEETKEIIMRSAPYFEAFHHVLYRESDIDLILDYCETYLPNQMFPDKAFDILDQVGAKTKIKSDDSIEAISKLKDDFNKLMEEPPDEKVIEKALSEYIKKMSEISNAEPKLCKITKGSINKVFAEKVGLPEKIIGESSSSFSLFEEKMKKEIFGQDEVIDGIYNALSCVKVGMNDPSKPLANFLFVGPTSVGKTFTAKNIAKCFYGSDRAFIQINMSEYQDKTGISKLIGANAGYVGYEEGGLLTEFVRKNPNCIVLFDEIEKADPKILDILLHLLDEGSLSDNLNRDIDFSKTIVILTTNIGHSEADKPLIGFNTKKNKEEDIYKKSLKNHLRPELISRIENIHVFKPLDDKVMRDIITKEVKILSSRMKSKKISVSYQDEIIDLVLKKIKSENLHARAIKGLVRKLIQTPIAKFLIKNHRRKKISLKILDKKLKIT